MHAGVGPGRAARALRRPGVGRARRRHARRGRHVPLPARGFPRHAPRAGAAFPFRLAVHLQRAFGDRFGLHRLRPVRELFPARHAGVADQAGGSRRRHGRRCAALPPHHRHRQTHCGPVDRDAAYRAVDHCGRRLAVRRQARLRLSSRRVRVFTRVRSWPGQRHAHRHVLFPGLLRYLLCGRRGAAARTA